MIEVGQEVKFDPFQYMQGFGVEDNKGRLVKGKVVYVNRKHKWFSVKYGKLRTSFKFCQIGKDVTICG